MMIKAVLIALVMMVSPALAQHAHHKGPNGGPMEDVAGVHVELVTAGSDIIVYVTDEAGKPVPTSGFSASALITAGTQKGTVKLEPLGSNQLKGGIKAAVAPGSNVVLMIKTTAGKSGQAKFKI